MWLFLIRSTLRSGWRVGASIGCGIALVDGAYAALGATRAAALLTFEPLRIVLGLAGAVLLVVLGVRTFLSALQVRAVGPRAVRLADGVAGLGLTTFGGVLGYRTLTHSP